jgi:nucleotide-binding universal stress UspA family protein
MIRDCANAIQCDLLIMGTVARGISGLLMGNTADAVLRQIKCSVLTVKPTTFISPVKPD